MSAAVGSPGDTAHSRHEHHGHGHGHEHSHEHDHERWPDEERAKGGPVVLDVGGDVGALIVTIESGRVGSELFIRPTGDPHGEFHVAVWERDLPGGRTVAAAVFGSLPAGTYAVLDRPAGAELLQVMIRGGDVVEHHLPTERVPAWLRSAPGDRADHHAHGYLEGGVGHACA